MLCTHLASEARAVRVNNPRGRRGDHPTCYPTNSSFAFFATFAVNPRCRKGHRSGAKRQHAGRGERRPPPVIRVEGEGASDCIAAGRWSALVRPIRLLRFTRLLKSMPKLSAEEPNCRQCETSYLTNDTASMCGLRLKCQIIHRIVAAGLSDSLEQPLTCGLDSP